MQRKGYEKSEKKYNSLNHSTIQVKITSTSHPETRPNSDTSVIIQTNTPEPTTTHRTHRAREPRRCHVNI